MVTDALEGRSGVDGLVGKAGAIGGARGRNADGAVVGAVAYAVRPRDGTGLLLWMHCRQDARTADALIGHALAALAPRPVHVFHFASSLSLGLEALLARHRPATARAWSVQGSAVSGCGDTCGQTCPPKACPDSTSVTGRAQPLPPRVGDVRLAR